VHEVAITCSTRQVTTAEPDSGPQPPPPRVGRVLLDRIRKTRPARRKGVRSKRYDTAAAVQPTVEPKPVVLPDPISRAT